MTIVGKCAQLIAIAALMACTENERATKRSAVVLLDLVGVEHRPLQVKGAAHVLLFVTVDCPISNNYAPEIRRLVADYGSKGVRFFLVHVDPDVDVTQALAHAEDYDLPRPVLLDPEHRLVAATGAEVTPEAVVVTPSQPVAYRGRIDDWYADLGRKRQSGPGRRDLRAALDAVLEGRPLPVTRTEAVGCYIPTR